MRGGFSSLLFEDLEVLGLRRLIGQMRPRSKLRNSPNEKEAADGLLRFLRKRLIGKTAHVLIDYVKPKDGEYEERECVTITYGTQNT